MLVSTVPTVRTRRVAFSSYDPFFRYNRSLVVLTFSCLMATDCSK